MTAGRRAPEAGTPELAGDALGPVTTDQLVAATGVSRETLYEWVSWRLLPRPQVLHTRALWPHGTLERAQFIAEKLATHSFGEICEMARQRWPSTSRG